MPRRARPPLVPEGEPVADPESVIAGIDPAFSVTAVAFSPDGRLLASGSDDRTLRLWDPATGRPQSILLGSRDGLWVACHIAEGLCRRYSDGTLLTRKGEDGRVEPVPLPPAVGHARLEIEPVRHTHASRRFGRASAHLAPSQAVRLRPGGA